MALKQSGKLARYAHRYAYRYAKICPPGPERKTLKHTGTHTEFTDRTGEALTILEGRHTPLLRTLPNYMMHVSLYYFALVGLILDLLNSTVKRYYCIYTILDRCTKGSKHNNTKLI